MALEPTQKRFYGVRESVLVTWYQPNGNSQWFEYDTLLSYRSLECQNEQNVSSSNPLHFD